VSSHAGSLPLGLGVRGASPSAAGAPPAPPAGPPAAAPPSAEAPTPAPRRTSAPHAIQDHEVWLEGNASAAARLPLADRYRTSGVALWRLGHEDPSLWTLIERWRRAAP